METSGEENVARPQSGCAKVWQWERVYVLRSTMCRVLFFFFFYVQSFLFSVLFLNVEVILLLWLNTHKIKFAVLIIFKCTIQ